MSLFYLSPIRVFAAGSGLGKDVQAVSQSGPWSMAVASGAVTIISTGPAHTSFVPVKCVKTDNSGFESCAGSGGGATQDVNIVSTFSASNPGYVSEGAWPTLVAISTAASDLASFISSFTGVNSSTAPTRGIAVGGADHNGLFNQVQVDARFGHRSLYTIAADLAADMAAEGMMYSTSFGSTLNTVNVEYDVGLLVNLSTSTLNAYLWRTKVDVVTVSGGVTFKFYINSVVSSSGTVNAIYNRRITTMDGEGPSGQQFFTTPTVTARGTRRLGSITTTAQSNTGIDSYDFSIVLTPGTSLLITAIPSVKDQEAFTTLIWAGAP